MRIPQDKIGSNFFFFSFSLALSKAYSNIRNQDMQLHDKHSFLYYLFHPLFPFLFQCLPHVLFFFIVLINVTLSINVLVPHAILMGKPLFSCFFRVLSLGLIMPCAVTRLVSPLSYKA